MSVEATPETQGRARAFTFDVETRSRVEFTDITARIEELLEASRVEGGVCHVFVPHTSAALLINENADPSLRKDLDDFLKSLAPRDRHYVHDDGNCDAHLKAALLGCSKTLLVEKNRLVLGRWQGIFFCEFDGPRQRSVRVKIVAD
ncbi:MAG: secondary thiamine-phosphate synthase enzyme YjbQ [Terriglobia bacterium]